MNIRNQIRSYLMAVVAMGTIACNTSDLEEAPLTPEATYDVVLRASHGSLSRTELGESDGSAQAIRWSVGDQLLTWAASASTGNYAFEGTTFTLSTFNATYETADFMATVGTMEEGLYTYYATYPLPENRNGTEVSYTLPTLQSGTYDPALDVMTSTVTGNALLPRSARQVHSSWEEPIMHFNHLFHLLRIRIPEGKNLLGQPINRLDVIFPQEVVGTVTFDVKDPVGTATWSNLSNKISVELPDNGTIDAGSGYIWLHIKPGTLTGNLRFRAYSNGGVPSQEIAASIDKTFEAQRVTPIALTIPSSDESAAMTMTFSCPDNTTYPNFLGEAATTMYVKSWPSKLKPIAGTTNTITGSNGLFTVKFYALDTEEYQYGMDVENQQMTVAFSSAHADRSTIDYTMAIPRLKDSQNSYFALPYLYFEDFSGILTFSYNDNLNSDVFSTNTSGTTLDDTAGLAGWTGARCGGSAGKGIRIDVRTEAAGSFFGTARYCGRIDSPALQRILSATNVTVSFNYAFSNDDSKHTHYASWGYHNTTGVINGKQFGGAFSSTKGSSTIANPMKTNVTITGGDYDSVTNSASYTISGCQSSYRMAWDAYSHGTSIGNSDAWLYIDNIKVSVGSSTKHTGLDYKSYFPNHTN